MTLQKTHFVERPATLARWRTLVLLFGPPALWAMARSWLQWREDLHPFAEAFAMSPLPTQQTAWALLRPGLLAVLGVLLLGVFLSLWWRRGGARQVRALLASCWMLAWLAAVAALWLAQANRADLGPTLVTATSAHSRVLGTRPRMPDMRQLGGSELVLHVEGLDDPQRVQISDLAAAQLRPGDALVLRWAPGRYSGRYVLAWARLAEAVSPAEHAGSGAAALRP